VIYVGTSGFSFEDWRGSFYPPGIPRGQMLNYYGTRFPAVEINSTYYRLPHPQVTRQLAMKTPEGFRFTVKLQAEVTHRLSRDSSAYDAFRRVIEPLREAGKYAGTLAQFPWSFRAGSKNRDFLAFLRRAHGPGPIHIEFRHDSWAVPDTFRLLEDLGLGFCCVDEPSLEGLFPPLVHVCGPVAYVRLHGRNARQWWDAGPLRYDYLYSEEELRAWADRIRELAGRSREVLVFFNNCHRGQAAENALRMGELLGPAGGSTGSAAPAAADGT